MSSPRGRRWSLCRFNGAALFRARRCAMATISLLSRLIMLQRGRALSSAEIEGFTLKFAHVFGLQRGRALSSAEILRHQGRGRHRRRCFNGAALFRARRYRLSAGHSQTVSSRFNGAALFRARRSPGHRHCREGARGFNGAALFRARRLNPSTRTHSHEPRFNGAALFRARRCRDRTNGVTEGD